MSDVMSPSVASMMLGNDWKSTCGCSSRYLRVRAGGRGATAAAKGSAVDSGDSKSLKGSHESGWGRSG